MTDTPPMGVSDGAGQAPLALALGCTFGLECLRATSAIMQVAPRPERGVSIRHEAWDTDDPHHCYVDHYGNRCERFALEPGETRIAYEARVLLPNPADVIAPTALETPVAMLRSLAITFCRALNIPARYVFGYLPDDVPQSEPIDFAAWFEAYLDGRWHTFDARNNTPRVGRVVVGRGRDATDVALITSFGPLTLTGFEVRTDRIPTAHPGAAR